ncbi:hypothetical protein GCM10010361_12430 [Streptomyces olivaceiscleroticus]|uniref:Uncharacterized protein n=1 Tax=Streptomyces olivaceiscleroticus TaxID=68245 RepID=A0ABN0ZJA2_9ACTN
MPDTGFPLRAGHQAYAGRRRPWTAVTRQGLALRFILIIGDERLAEALRVVCDHDTVAVDFPETSIRIDLSSRQPPEEAGVVLDCRASYPSGDRNTSKKTGSWQRILAGRPGAPHQREALVRDILAARREALRPDRRPPETGPTSLHRRRGPAHLPRARLFTPLPLKECNEP